MPIRFRCSRCHRLLGIARRKAGSETRCPHCGATIMVPREDETDEVRTEFDDIDDLVNPVSLPPAEGARPSVATRPAPPPIPRSARIKTVPNTLPPDERPLFERDVEAVLEVMSQSTGTAESKKARPVAVVGQDAMSLEPERSHIVVSSQMATAIAVIVVVLMALSFGAGFWIASH